MKTGRLLKFHRPGGDVHVYLYQEDDGAHATIFALAPGYERAPIHEIAGRVLETVEAEARAWIEARFPRAF